MLHFLVCCLVDFLNIFSDSGILILPIYVFTGMTNKHIYLPMASRYYQLASCTSKMLPAPTSLHRVPTEMPCKGDCVARHDGRGGVGAGQEGGIIWWRKVSSLRRFSPPITGIVNGKAWKRWGNSCHGPSLCSCGFLQSFQPLPSWILCRSRPKDPERASERATMTETGFTVNFLLALSWASFVDRLQEIRAERSWRGQKKGCCDGS